MKTPFLKLARLLCAAHAAWKGVDGNKHWPVDVLGRRLDTGEWDLAAHRCRCGVVFWRSPDLVVEDAQ